jgi:hypothetical protein
MSDAKTTEVEAKPGTVVPERTSLLTDEVPAVVDGGGDEDASVGAGDSKESASSDEKSPAEAPNYDELKLPEGVELDKEGFDEVKAIGKEYGLPAEGMQKLIDKHISTVQAAAGEPYRLFKEMVGGWEDEVKKDPEIGGENFPKMRTTIGRAFDQYVPKDRRAAFDQALTMTGAGSNPEIIRTFYRMAKQLTEGGHVQGRPVQAKRPSTLGEALGYTSNGDGR